MSEAPSLLELLRLRTAGLHQQVEALATAVLSERGARWTKNGFLEHTAILEAHHRQVLAACPPRHWAERLLRDRCDELHDDLTTHGRVSTARGAIPDQMGMLTREEAVGAAYVIEGSRLGSVAIAKQLQRAGVDTSAFRTFASSGDLLKARWREFRARLAECPPSTWSPAADGAEGCFRALLTAYEHPAAAPPSSGRAPERLGAAGFHDDAGRPGD